MASSVSTIAQPQAPGGYFAFHLAWAEAIQHAPTELCYCSEGDTHARRFCRAGDPLGGVDLKGILSSGSLPLLISEANLPLFGEGVLKESWAVLQDSQLPQSERFAVLAAGVSGPLEHARKLIKPIHVVEHAKRLAQGVSELLDHGQVCPEAMFSSPRTGSYFASHAANVSCYAALLAIAMGTSDKEDLARIALGAALHDIGLWKPPAELSIEERKSQEFEHPQVGYELMLDDPSFDRRQLMMIYQHHERIDSSGWPVAVSGAEIHPWARILAVVDCFDELTNPLQPGGGVTAAESFSRLRTLAGDGLDEELVRCWTQVMAKA